MGVVLRCLGLLLGLVCFFGFSLIGKEIDCHNDDSAAHYVLTWRTWDSEWYGMKGGLVQAGDTYAGDQGDNLGPYRVRWYATLSDYNSGTYCKSTEYEGNDAVHDDYSGPAPPDHHCVYTVSWRNTNSWGAQPVFFYEWGDDSISQVGEILSYVAPGHTMSFTWTNWIAAADWTAKGSACPTLLLYDNNDPTQNQLKDSFSGEDHTSGGGGSSGSGPIDDSGGGGLPPTDGTNSATGGDLGRLGQALAESFGLFLGELKKKANKVTLQGATNVMGVGNQRLADLRSIMGATTNYLIAATNFLSRTTNYLASVTNLLGLERDLLSRTTNYLSVLTNQTSGVTNLLAQQWTNSVGISNLLGGVGLTNGAATNVVGLGMVPSTATNAAAAFAAGSNGVWAAGVVILGSSSDGSSVTNAGGGLVGSGSPAALSFSFCGTTIDLDPEVRFPGVAAMAKAAWTFVILASFCLWAGQWIWEAVGRIGSAQTGGVSDLNATLLGFGGNVVGLVVAFAVPAAFIALWVGSLTTCASLILSWSGLMPAAAAAVGVGGNQTALYLINLFFPVSLALGVLGARISIPFTGAKVFLVSAAASRWLFGK